MTSPEEAGMESQAKTSCADHKADKGSYLEAVETIVRWSMIIREAGA